MTVKEIMNDLENQKTLCDEIKWYNNERFELSEFVNFEINLFNFKVENNMTYSEMGEQVKEFIKGYSDLLKVDRELNSIVTRLTVIEWSTKDVCLLTSYVNARTRLTTELEMLMSEIKNQTGIE